MSKGVRVETDPEHETVVGVNRTIKIKALIAQIHAHEYEGYVSVRGVNKLDLVSSGGFFLKVKTLDEFCLKWLRARELLSNTVHIPGVPEQLVGRVRRRGGGACKGMPINRISRRSG